MTQSISNKELYDAISSLRGEVIHRFEIVEEKVASHDAWINQITGKMTILMIFVGAGVNFLMDKVFGNKQ